MSKTDQTIVFTGTKFKTTGYTAKASFNGVDADSVAIDSETQATATWTQGVPVATAEAVPTLAFKKDDTTETYYAVTEAKQANPLSVTSSSAVTCSFAGGCKY